MINDGSQEQSSVRESSMGLGDRNSQEPQPESGGQPPCILLHYDSEKKFQEIGLLSAHPSGVPTTAKWERGWISLGDHNQNGNMPPHGVHSLMRSLTQTHGRGPDGRKGQCHRHRHVHMCAPMCANV